MFLTRRLVLVSTLLVFAFLTASCGYVGPVLPPSPDIPATITNLSAIERGDKIIVTFTTPARSTDGVAISSFYDIDLRAGPERQAPEEAKAYTVDPPSASDREDPQPKPIAYAVPASDWIGQRICLRVRTSMKKKGRLSDWSNAATLNVIPPLNEPVVQVAPSASGNVLTWPASADAQYQIQRQGPSDKQPLELATVNENRYVDVSAQYETEYRYTVTAKKGSAESAASEPVSISAPDIYPPAVPAGLTVLAGPNAVDLAWQRNAESDLQGYYVYRSVNGGPFERQGDVVTLPTFVDHNVEHGKTYSYKISALDKKGNDSAQSSAADVSF